MGSKDVRGFGNVVGSMTCCPVLPSGIKDLFVLPSPAVGSVADRKP